MTGGLPGGNETCGIVSPGDIDVIHIGTPRVTSGVT
jgi:hypothetical protein